MMKNENTRICPLENEAIYLDSPTLLKTPDFKGFYSSRFAIDSNMTAKSQDALLFTAEHLLVLGTDLIIQSAEK